MRNFALTNSCCLQTYQFLCLCV